MTTDFHNEALVDYHQSAVYSHNTFGLAGAHTSRRPDYWKSRI